MLIPNIAFSRPVSYPEGVTLQQFNDFRSNAINLHYSPTAKYSLGLRSEIMREDNIKLNTLQYNRLLKRWNLPEAQANAYLKVNLGVAESDGDIDPAARIGFAADYETRRFFTSYENQYTDAGDLLNEFTQRFQIGFAPYKA